MQEKIKCSCASCGAVYMLNPWKYQRSTKRNNGNLFCNRKCKKNFLLKSKEKRVCFHCQKEYIPNKPSSQSKFCSNACRIKIFSSLSISDEKSPFRKLFNNINSRKGLGKNDKRCLITLEDIINQWNRQGGICPYTKLKMVLPRNANDSICCPKAASVDRIDSKKPYTKENIQIICLSMNYAKNRFRDDSFCAFLEEIKKAQINAPSVLNCP